MAYNVDVRTLNAVTVEPVSRHERKERTRRALLDTALRLFAERGFGGVSLREVTKQAGIVPTAFYRHFASMEALGVALVDESMRTLRGMIRSARNDPRTSTGIIRASVRTLAEHVRANEAHYWFLIRERYGGTGEVRQAIGIELRLFSRELAVDLARFEYLREWSTEDLNMMADLIVTAMLGTVLDLLEARQGDTEADERIIRTAEKRLRLITLGVPGWRSAG
ncbi:TetR family transcriptional regulator [Prauserella endophytica]|uniref:TetR family transcriptional regulator n=1 Tax=Prauserella endophytica TaxID=1592324 RepID=A0ABY2S8H1_9PSEU|nr:TetR family transcriptional regulator [Prauserella endophytica]TKG71609.1 TetR family transcriptional regulator [Prauserella endophytica]